MTDGVAIGRLRVDGTVARDHPAPLAVRARLGEVAERLPTALGELLAPLARLGDQVVLIDRLELELELDTSRATDELARTWAARIAAAVAAAIRPEARGAMLVFPDHAHYLARFLVDAAEGRALEVWYYKRWRGLAPLTVAARLRTALDEVPARGLAALSALPRAELLRVLAALGAREARAFVETASTSASAGDLDAVVRALVAAIPSWREVAHALGSAWQAALALAAVAAGELAAGAGRAIAEVPELPALIALAAAIAARDRRERGSTVAAELARAGEPSIAPLLALGADARSAVLAAAAVDAHIDAQPRDGWYTRLGGLLLLLPRVAELPLDEVFGEAAGDARLQVLSRVAGPHRDEVLADPLWRTLCGARGLPVVGDLAAALWRRAAYGELRASATRDLAALAGDYGWLALRPMDPLLRAAIPASLAATRALRQELAWLAPDDSSPHELALTVAAQQALRAFARRLPGFAASSPRFLFDNFLDFDATVLVQDDLYHCRIGRARLAAIFGMTGALRGRHPVGDGRALELHAA